MTEQTPTTCALCGAVSSPGLIFCGHCGAQLSIVCANCGFGNPADFKFCGRCGAQLSTSPPAAPEAAASRREEKPPASQGGRAELRQVTVMFCDLTDSTELSRRLDAESYSAVLVTYRDICVAAARRHGGDVVRYLGDGLLIAFGYPTAHEDDARRALRAGLEISRAVAAAELPDTKDGGRLHTRIGVHTGLVVAGDIGSSLATERNALIGETTNIADRVQREADVDTVVASDATVALVRPYFVVEPLGKRSMKGLAAPIDLFVVRAESALRHRIEIIRSAAIPLVGRDEEIALLLGRWRRAVEKRGDTVLLSGEPGIGKSRLAVELCSRVQPMGGTTLTIGCSAYDTASALRPVIEVLDRDLAPDRTADNASLEGWANTVLAGWGCTDSAAMSALGSLLDLPSLIAASWQDLSPQRRRLETFELLTRWMLAKSVTSPVLTVIEDIHWADDSTIGFIAYLLEQVAHAAVFIVLTARPEFTPPASMRNHVSHIVLQALSPADARRLSLTVAHAPNGLADTLDHIIKQAEGVPLFIEELTREILERHQPHAERRTPVPATLRELLTARIDRLTDLRPLIQLGAALGGTFPFRLLAAVAGGDPEHLRAQVESLVEAQIFELQQGLVPNAVVSFRHALIQDVAAETTLRTQQVRIHRRVADVIVAQFPEIAERQPETLAVHLGKAGMLNEAIETWQRAGHRAGERSANVEAAHHYAEALALVRRLPDSQSAAHQELSLQISLGAQMIAVKGNGAPEVEGAFSRAQALCKTVEEPRLLFRALRGLQTFHMVRGRPLEARSIGERLLAIAKDMADGDLLMQAHRPHGLCLFYLGEFDAARDHLLEALSFYSPTRHTAHRYEYGSDPGVLARCNIGWVRWFMGDMRGAAADCTTAVAAARAIEHPHSLAFALAFLASVRQARGEDDQARAVAQELSELSRIHAFPYWRTWANVLGGWAHARLGDASAGIARIVAGMADYRSTGAELMLPYFSCLLAEARLLVGDLDGATEVLLAGSDVAERHQIRFYEPELMRLRGVVALRRQNVEDGIAILRKAIELAEHCGAHSIVLRSLISLLSAGAEGELKNRTIEHLSVVQRHVVGESHLPDIVTASRMLASRAGMT